MQAVILAAGKSTRTYPLTVTKPKPLLKVANKTILEHNLDQLEGLADEAIIVIGYLGDQIIEAIGETYKGIKIKYVGQKDLTGTGAALIAAKTLLKKEFLVMIGDDLFFHKDIKNALENKYAVLVKEVEDIRSFGEVIENKGTIEEFTEKPKEKRKGLASTGLLVLDRKVFEHDLKPSPRGELEIVDYVKYLIRKGEKVAIARAESWIPITYPWSLLEANEFLLRQMKGEIKGTVEKRATLKGSVAVGEGTLIRDGAYIEGPVIIGKGCVIGPNCFIRAYTAIGDKSKIGNAVEVKNSIIGEGTSVGHLSYVGDSIVGNDVNFGAGTITANLRHDNTNIKSEVKDALVDSGRRKLGAMLGDRVHTGIHTSIYPGRKIWPEKTTLPGEIVKKDIR